MKQKLKQLLKHPLGMIAFAALWTAVIVAAVYLLISLFILFIDGGEAFVRAWNAYITFFELAFLLMTIPYLMGTFIDQHYNGLPKGEPSSNGDLLVRVFAAWDAPLFLFFRVFGGDSISLILQHTFFCALAIGLCARGSYYSKKYKRETSEQTQRIKDLTDRLSEYENIYQDARRQ